MAFDIMSLFTPQARNMLMQPFATNPDNLLIAPQMHDYPVAGMQNALANPQMPPVPQNVPIPTPSPMQQAAPQPQQAPQQAPWMVPALGQGSPRINNPQMVAAGSQPTIGSMFGGAQQQDPQAPQGVDPMMTGATQHGPPVGSPQGAPAPQQGGLASFFSPDRKQSLNDFFTGLAAGSTPGQSFALGAAAVSQGSKDRNAQNDTEKWLAGRGVDPYEAKTLARSPTALNEYLKATFQKPQGEFKQLDNGDYGTFVNGQFVKQGNAAKPTAAFHQLTPDEIKARNLDPTKSYQVGVDGKVDAIGGGGTNISIDNGTIPAGMEATRDASGRIIRYDPIPGGPADTSKTDKAASESRQTLTDVVTTAAQRAREAMTGANIPTDGWTGQAAGKYLPGSNAADVRRQVAVLKSNATIEALNAMRAQSKTGGALGNVTEGEGTMLAAKAGALDPDSPNFQRDVNDYELTLLRTVHGYDEGTKIFNNTRKTGDMDAPKTPTAGNTSSGLKWSIGQ